MRKGRGVFKCIKTPVIPFSTKDRLVVEYSECSPTFVTDEAYSYSHLEEHRISLDDFNTTIKGAEEILRPFKGSVTRTDLCYLLFIFIGLIIVFIAGIVLGLIFNYLVTIIIIVVFVLIMVLSYIYLKRRNNRLLLYGYLALALYARCENNRIYLRKKVLVRPGYQCKWIEFNMSSMGGDNSTIGAP